MRIMKTPSAFPNTYPRTLLLLPEPIFQRNTCLVKIGTFVDVSLYCKALQDWKDLIWQDSLYSSRQIQGQSGLSSPDSLLEAWSRLLLLVTMRLTASAFEVNKRGVHFHHYCQLVGHEPENQETL